MRHLMDAQWRLLVSFGPKAVSLRRMDPNDKGRHVKRVLSTVLGAFSEGLQKSR